MRKTGLQKTYTVNTPGNFHQYFIILLLFQFLSLFTFFIFFNKLLFPIAKYCHSIGFVCSLRSVWALEILTNKNASRFCWSMAVSQNYDLPFFITHVMYVILLTSYMTHILVACPNKNLWNFSKLFYLQSFFRNTTEGKFLKDILFEICFPG